MARDQDREFDDFARAAWPRLRWAAYLLCGDHHLAEDLAQAALSRTYSRWRSVRRADAVAYTHRVLINLNIDRMRRRRPIETTDTVAEQRASHSAGPGQLAEDRDLVIRLLGQLTGREREVVVMRHYFDQSEAEVARELGISAGTVKSALSRALAKLRATAVHTPDLSKGMS
ncbi:MAG: SigE family RNA polymerase sigma factor [Nocardioides sp.]